MQRIINLDQTLSVLKSEIHPLDKSVAGSRAYSPTLYFIRQHDWDRGEQNLVRQINSAGYNRDYSNLLQGIILMGRENPDAALLHLGKLTPASSYYPDARVNMALINLSQNRRDRALEILLSLLARTDVQTGNRLKNRVRLMLGYLYYRVRDFVRANDMFQQVDPASSYYNRALYGRALTAFELQQYNSAESLLQQVGGGVAHDLVSDETRLLLAYISESQQRYQDASRAYSEAVLYYQMRIDDIDELLRDDVQSAFKFIRDRHVLVVDDNLLQGELELPMAFYDNYSFSIDIMEKVTQIAGNNTRMYKRAKALKEDYEQVIGQVITSLLVKRRQNLQDYLQQSRYRLARTSDRARQALQAGSQ